MGPCYYLCDKKRHVSVICGKACRHCGLHLHYGVGVLRLLKGKLGHHIEEEASFLGVEGLVLLLRHNVFLWWQMFRKLMIGHFQTIWRFQL